MVLEAAVKHAKQQEPVHANRRAAALVFVREMLTEARLQRRFEDAVHIHLLWFRMKDAETLQSLLVVLQQEQGDATGSVPPTSNRGVRSSSMQAQPDPDPRSSAARTYEQAPRPNEVETAHNNMLHAALSDFISGR